MSRFDVDFLSLGLATVGLFFICCAIIQKKPKHILAELFGVNKRGLRDLKASVFKRNQVVMGFVCVVVAIVLTVFSKEYPSGGGYLDRFSPSLRVLWLVLFMASLCGILNYLSRLWSKAAFKRLVVEVVTEYQWPFEDNMVLTREIGRLLGVPQDEDDTVEIYVAKIRRHLGIPLEFRRENSVRGISKIG